jgi:hypothetical protein
MARSEMDISQILLQVVDPVGQHHSLRELLEVVIKHPNGSACEERALTEEIAELLAGLQVDAQDRIGGIEVVLLESGDRLELGVAIRVASQRLHPQGLPLMEAVPVEQLIDDMHTDMTATILHEINDLDLGQVRPDERLLGGAAGGVRDEDLAEVVVDLGIVVEPPLPTAARLADPGRGLVCQQRPATEPLSESQLSHSAIGRSRPWPYLTSHLFLSGKRDSLQVS